MHYICRRNIFQQMRSLFLMATAITLACSCSKDHVIPDPGPPPPFTGLSGNTITVTMPAGGLPADIIPDRIEVEIKGFDWQIIDRLEAPVIDGTAVLSLPVAFAAGQLQEVDRSNGMGGHWPGAVSDPGAKVASLGDIIAWQGGSQVGRFYISDRKGPEETAGKSFIYYHFSDRPYALTGLSYNSSGKRTGYTYDCAFHVGWNAYANINPGTTGSTLIRTTTNISHDTELQWRFEAWVHR